MNSIYKRIQNLRQTLHVGTLPSQRQDENQQPRPAIQLGNGQIYSPVRVKSGSRGRNSANSHASRSKSPARVFDPRIMLAAKTLPRTITDSDATATLNNSVCQALHNTSMRLKASDGRMTNEELIRDLSPKMDSVV